MTEFKVIEYRGKINPKVDLSVYDKDIVVRSVIAKKAANIIYGENSIAEVDILNPYRWLLGSSNDWWLYLEPIEMETKYPTFNAKINARYAPIEVQNAVLTVLAYQIKHFTW